MLGTCVEESLLNSRNMKKGDVFIKSFLITEDIYLNFISLFKDNNPLHTNLVFAKSKGFDKVVMHGNILNGFISYFIGECLPTKNVILIKQEINYRQPFFIDDKLTFESQISDVYTSVGMVSFKYKFLNQNQLKVANGKIQIKLL